MHCVARTLIICTSNHFSTQTDTTNQPNAPFVAESQIFTVHCVSFCNELTSLHGINSFKLSVAGNVVTSKMSGSGKLEDNETSLKKHHFMILESL